MRHGYEGSNWSSIQYSKKSAGLTRLAERTTLGGFGPLGILLAFIFKIIVVERRAARVDHQRMQLERAPFFEQRDGAVPRP